MILEPNIPPLTAESMILLYQGRYICSVNLCIGAGQERKGEMDRPWKWIPGESSPDRKSNSEAEVWGLSTLYPSCQ